MAPICFVLFDQLMLKNRTRNVCNEWKQNIDRIDNFESFSPSFLSLQDAGIEVLPFVFLRQIV